jgi:hypothetical protein
LLLVVNCAKILGSIAWSHESDSGYLESACAQAAIGLDCFAAMTPVARRITTRKALGTPFLAFEMKKPPDGCWLAAQVCVGRKSGAGALRE